MFGFLFWSFFVVSFALIAVGVYFYIKDKERQGEDDDNSEVRIWGLNPATFYCISMISLIILFLLYENPTSVKWEEQHKIDKQQNELIDSFCVVIKGLKSVNNLPAPSIVPPFDVRSISCSCLYQMIE